MKLKSFKIIQTDSTPLQHSSSHFTKRYLSTNLIAQMEINQNTEIKVQNQVVICHKMTAKHEASPLPDKELSQMCNNNLWEKKEKSPSHQQIAGPIARSL